VTHRTEPTWEVYDVLVGAVLAPLHALVTGPFWAGATSRSSGPSLPGCASNATVASSSLTPSTTIGLCSCLRPASTVGRRR
jgi:hypothetical protein